MRRPSPLRAATTREDGQALAYEAFALALVIFAILGAVSLVGRLG